MPDEWDGAQGTDAACCAKCGTQAISIERDWVMNSHDDTDQRVWFICAECRDQPGFVFRIHGWMPSRMLVVMPDGYRVRADARYDEFQDDASLFGMSVDGIGEHGERVTVRGTHIARISRDRP